MSLINQMLRDLNQQKKGDAKPASELPRRSVMERIPYLPLPVVLSGTGLLLLCLIWWLAGVLSDVMFGFEPVATKAESPQVVAVEGGAVAAQEASFAIAKDQLTLAEREAEAEDSPLANEAVVETLKAPVTGSVEQRKPLDTEVEAKPAVVKKERVTKVVKPVAKVVKPVAKVVKPVAKVAKPAARVAKPKSPSVRAAATPAPEASPAKAPVTTPRRVHPDELPGAIPSLSKPAVERIERVERVQQARRLPATTPYGMAEEAFLDGKWAFERERSQLAIRSLQEALELYPGHLPARELLVKILNQEGKHGEAMFLLAEGLEVAPDYLPFKKSYARLLSDQGDYDAATRIMLNGGLPAVEDDPEAHVVLASLYQRLGESFLAAQTYRNLLVSWPQTGAFWVGLGGALEGQKMQGEAVECYRKALETENLRKDLLAYAKKRLRLLN